MSEKNRAAKPNARPGGNRVKIAVILGSLFVILGCSIAVVLMLVNDAGASLPGLPSSSAEPTPQEVAEQQEDIDLNEETGELYVNNEVLVYTVEGASDAQAQRLFSSVGASSVDDSMGHIGLYRLIFDGPLTYDELMGIVDELSASSLVESAMLNPVLITGEDATPNDPWGGASWSVADPDGNNWGMEAIDAPGAWDHLDELAETRVGVYDTPVNENHDDLRGVLQDSTHLDYNLTTLATGESESATARDHGTHVSGTIAAEWNNGEGVTGVMGDKGLLYTIDLTCWYDRSRTDYEFVTAHAYLYALSTLLENDVRVINISQFTSRLIGFAASHGNTNAQNVLQAQADIAETGLARIIEQRQEQGRPDFVICISAGNSNAIGYYPDSSSTYGYSEDPVSGSRAQSGGSLAIYNNFLALIDDEAVMNRIIVVGSVGIDQSSSHGEGARYAYSYFACVGDRVDVVAPGESVYSCTVSGYGLESGTSMAAPHATGVAGLVFAANPSLTGPEVKRIVMATAEGRYYHGDSYSGLVNASAAVEAALQTQEESVGRVIASERTNGLDLCFVVDTTGSMGDDIDNARQNMTEILSSLAARTENYRVAIVDYRDFASRTGDSDDYPSSLQLDFTNDDAQITAAIDALDLGYGGDDEETVYSGLMQAVSLGWRDDAEKVVIVLGDAAPLDPEPVTGYTYGDVLMALYNGGIGIDFDSSDTRVLGEADDSLITVFSIGTGASSDALDFFDDISAGTGGTSVDIGDASEVADAITSTIDQIEVEAGVTADLSFGREIAGRRVDLYATGGAGAGGAGAGAGGAGGSATEPGEYLFSFTTDETGSFTVEALPEGSYVWTTDGPAGGGTLTVATGGEQPILRKSDSFWFAPLSSAWDGGAPFFVAGLVAVVALSVAAPILMGRLAARPARAATSGERFCPHCGKPVPAAARFCRHCGNSIQ